MIWRAAAILIGVYLVMVAAESGLLTISLIFGCLVVGLTLLSISIVELVQRLIAKLRRKFPRKKS